MADYKVKKKTTTYNENYPYSPSESSSVIKLSKQDYSYLILDGMVDVWIHDPNIPEHISGRGEYYPGVNGYSVTISRWPMSSFFIVSSSQDLGADMIDTGRLTTPYLPTRLPTATPNMCDRAVWKDMWTYPIKSFGILRFDDL